MLTERERRIARQAYQAGYGRGHDDTVEGCYNSVCEHENECADEWLEEWQEHEAGALNDEAMLRGA